MIEYTQTWDMDGAADAFPDINFVIYHVGVPFIDETCWQLIRFPNLYASLAVGINFIARAPRQFAELLGKLLFWCGEDKIVYGSEAPIWQPQWALQAFWDFQIPRICARATATHSSPTRPSARSSARTCSACTAWTSPTRWRGSGASKRLPVGVGKLVQNLEPVRPAGSANPSCEQPISSASCDSTPGRRPVRRMPSVQRQHLSVDQPLVDHRTLDRRP